MLCNLISNYLDVDLDLETLCHIHVPKSNLHRKLDVGTQYIGLQLVIIKFHQVLIENDLQLDINAKLDLESQNKNQK